MKEKMMVIQSTIDKERGYKFVTKQLKNGYVQVVQYYPDGKRIESRWIENKDGKIDGLFEQYYKNGHLKERTFYKNGNREGISELYYASGVLAERITYRNDIVAGLYESYTRNGKRIRKELLFGNRIIKASNVFENLLRKKEDKDRQNLIKKLEELQELKSTQLKKELKQLLAKEYRKTHPKKSVCR